MPMPPSLSGSPRNIRIAAMVGLSLSVVLAFAALLAAFIDRGALLVTGILAALCLGFSVWCVNRST